MPDIRTILADASEDDVRPTLSPDALRRRADRRRRRRTLTGVIGGLGLLATLSLGAVAMIDDVRAGRVELSGTGGRGEQPDSRSPDGLTPIDLSDFHIFDLAEVDGGDGLVALGSSVDVTKAGGSVLLFSPDAERWYQTERTPAGVDVTFPTVTAGEGEVLAVMTGCRPGRPEGSCAALTDIWRTTDGFTWQPVSRLDGDVRDNPFARAAPDAVWTGREYAVVADDGRIWRSPDGARWTRGASVPFENGGEPGRSAVGPQVSVAISAGATRGVFVADPDLRDFRPVDVTGALAALLAHEEASLHVRQLWWDGRGFVAVIHADRPGGDAPQAPALYRGSADGTTWTRLADALPELFPADQLPAGTTVPRAIFGTLGGRGVALVLTCSDADGDRGCDPDGNFRTVVFTSDDGDTWSRERGPVGG